MEFNLNKDVDLEMKPLKALKKRIKNLHKQQIDELYAIARGDTKDKNTNQKDPNQTPNFNTDAIPNQDNLLLSPTAGTDKNIAASLLIDDDDKKKKKPAYHFKGIKKMDKELTAQQMLQFSLGGGDGSFYN